MLWELLITGEWATGEPLVILRIYPRVEAHASLMGYPGSGNSRFNSREKCVDAWQDSCVLGIHPHPVDPAFMRPPSASTASFVNTTLRKSTPRPSGTSPVKEEMRDGKQVGTPANAQLLADLWVCMNIGTSVLTLHSLLGSGIPAPFAMINRGRTRQRRGRCHG
jgi:hypothetical protein